VFVTACGGGDGNVSTAPEAVRTGALAAGAVSQVAPMYALDFVGTGHIKHPLRLPALREQPGAPLASQTRACELELRGQQFHQR